MQKRSWWVMGLGVGALVVALPALSQSSPVEQREAQTQIRETLREQAQEWGLTERDWERYETLMEGARGIWSPDLDPITALGVEARTDAERRRYAELLVEVERERVEREFAFERAYQEAWHRLYPDELRVDPFEVRAPLGSGEGGLFQTSSQGQRLSVHVAAQDCERCDEMITELLQDGAAMDIFVIDSEGDDQVIRQWARERSIPVNRVQAREITLNHGAMDAALGVTPESVPQVFSNANVN